MQILMLGVDHTTAPIALREQLSLSKRQLPQLLEAMCAGIHECVILSTCNRFEVYLVCQDAAGGERHLLQTLSTTRAIAEQELRAHCYLHVDTQAVAHLFGVACGLYSLVPGEAQIQGQVAESLEVAQGAGYAGPITSALFRAAIVAGKRARSETAISRNAASISQVAVQLARRLFPDLNSAGVLLVGSGKMSELAAQNLCEHGAQGLVIINRTQSHAIDLAHRYGARYRSFAELASSLAEADVVISSTTAPRAVITREMMEKVMQQRAGRSLLLIDIALPRDVEPSVAQLPGIHLYNLDDLQTGVDEGVRLRLQEVEQVQAIIAQESDAFERWLRSLSVTGTISDLRRHVEEVRQQELTRAIRQLSPRLEERDLVAVQQLTTRLVNKLLHVPTLRLKHAATEGQGHVYTEAIRYLFDLEVQTDEAFNHWHASQQTGDDTDKLGHRTTASARPADQHRADSHDG